MGDSGSMLLGLTVAAAAIVVTGPDRPRHRLDRGSSCPAFVPILLPVAVLIAAAAGHGARRDPPASRAGQVAVPPGPHAPAPPAARARAHAPPRGADHVPVDRGVRASAPPPCGRWRPSRWPGRVGIVAAPVLVAGGDCLGPLRGRRARADGRAVDGMRPNDRHDRAVRPDPPCRTRRSARRAARATSWCSSPPGQPWRRHRDWAGVLAG